MFQDKFPWDFKRFESLIERMEPKSCFVLCKHQSQTFAADIERITCNGWHHNEILRSQTAHLHKSKNLNAHPRIIESKFNGSEAHHRLFSIIIRKNIPDLSEHFVLKLLISIEHWTCANLEFMDVFIVLMFTLIKCGRLRFTVIYFWHK